MVTPIYQLTLGFVTLLKLGGKMVKMLSKMVYQINISPKQFKVKRINNLNQFEPCGPANNQH